MRKDMGKCVIEAPRGGSRRPNPKVRHFGRFIIDDEGNPDYEGLLHIPSSFRGALIALGDRKEFSDKVGPLNGYLKSCCGRPWNDVYSEIKQVLGNAGWGLQHIITAHLEVATNTYRGVDGNVWACNKRGVEKVGGHYYWRNKFYVEPETGILREVPRTRRKNAPVEPPDRIPLTQNTEYRKLEGIWYHREFTEVEQIIPLKVRYGVHYETTVVVVSEKKRQLGKKQLKELRLKNG